MCSLESRISWNLCTVNCWQGAEWGSVEFSPSPSVTGTEWAKNFWILFERAFEKGNVAWASGWGIYTESASLSLLVPGQRPVRLTRRDVYHGERNLFNLLMVRYGSIHQRSYLTTFLYTHTRSYTNKREQKIREWKGTAETHLCVILSWKHKYQQLLHLDFHDLQAATQFRDYAHFMACLGDSQC